jgi:hypothetical protein
LPEVHPSRNGAIISRRIENEILLLNRKTNQYHILNETAAMIWELADGRRTVSDIIDSVSGTYSNSDDVIPSDVTMTLDGLKVLGLITLE